MDTDGKDKLRMLLPDIEPINSFLPTEKLCRQTQNREVAPPK